MDEIRNKAIEQINSSFDDEINKLENQPHGTRPSARGTARKQQQRLARINELNEKKDNKEAKVLADITKLQDIMRNIISDGVYDTVPEDDGLGGGAAIVSKEVIVSKEEEWIEKKIIDLEAIKTDLEAKITLLDANKRKLHGTPSRMDITNIDSIQPYNLNETQYLKGYRYLVFGTKNDKKDETSLTGGKAARRGKGKNPPRAPRKSTLSKTERKPEVRVALGKDDDYDILGSGDQEGKDDDYDIIESSIFKLISRLIEIRDIGYFYLDTLLENRIIKYEKELENVNNALETVMKIKKVKEENRAGAGERLEGINNDGVLSAALAAAKVVAAANRKRKSHEEEMGRGVKMWKTTPPRNKRGFGNFGNPPPSPSAKRRIIFNNGGAKKTRKKTKSSKLRKTIKKRRVKKIKRKSIRRRKPIKKRVNSKNRKVKRKIKNKTKKYKKPKKQKRSRKPKP